MRACCHWFATKTKVVAADLQQNYRDVAPDLQQKYVSVAPDFKQKHAVVAPDFKQKIFYIAILLGVYKTYLML